MTRIYGVSTGNGNDGVSHMFADYYVRTDDPWTLATAATVSIADDPEYRAWLLDVAEIDGEPDYTIYATVYDPPESETDNDEGSDEGSDEGMSWCDVNGAWLIVEVFPEDEPRKGRPVYESLEDAISADVLAMVRAGS